MEGWSPSIFVFAGRFLALNAQTLETWHRYLVNTTLVTYRLSPVGFQQYTIFMASQLW
jgi:hypothetical protein